LLLLGTPTRSSDIREKYARDRLLKRKTAWQETLLDELNRRCSRRLSGATARSPFALSMIALSVMFDLIRSLAIAIIAGNNRVIAEVGQATTNR